MDKNHSFAKPMSLDEMAAKALGLTSFSAVGHLIHINLKDHLLERKYQIGKALLDQHRRALAVVNKVNSIDNTFRNFDIEIIAKREGCEKSDEELMICEVNENKIRYQLDFSKVYWNSRLSTEHERIIGKLNKFHDVVFDLFAGVGPFSVPAAKAKCKVYANDLNPESTKWLEINMRRNKVEKDMYEIFNIDATDFIVDKLRPKLIQEYTIVDDLELATKPTIHILMNLPAIAPTFLPHFVGLLKNGDSEELLNKFRKQALNHIVYCYCFLKGVYDDPNAQVRYIIEENFGRQLTEEQLVGIFRVRNVAPYKEMYRVEIRLDEQILFGQKNIVGIMRGPSNRISLNGTNKKVTIQVPNGKRAHEENSDTSSGSDTSAGDEGSDTKRMKSSYCTVI